MDYRMLTTTLLFKGMGQDEAAAMLTCLAAYEKSFPKGACIMHAGQQVQDMGLVLSGGVNIAIDDVWGNNTILGHVGPGQLFAETYACIPGEPLLVDVTVSQDSEILFLNASRLLTVCQKACPYHNQLIQNLLQISARKNLDLSRRSVHTSAKSIRGRLTSYLSEQAQRAGGCRFSIPFDRQQLADYLGVDRSALSNELGRMRDDGVLTFHKNEFHLLVR